MNNLLLERSTGSLAPKAFAQIHTTHRIHSIQPCPTLRFNGGETEVLVEDSDNEDAEPSGGPKIWAHQVGVNALAIDIDNRILVSGGADFAIRLWDLEQCATLRHVLTPCGEVAKSTSTHKFGITHLSFYPFDSAAFLSSSYDHHLKLYATETLEVSADFDLGSIIYSHAISPIASHLLVACATQTPVVRLVDLRSGLSTHSLAGHRGALLSVAWSPTRDYVLASGGVDGAVRLWDVRKSSGALGVLDMEDSTGIAGTNGMGRSARDRDSGKSHAAPVNGISWTDNGAYLISAGHDARIRVWDAATGANTLASFGPTIANGHLSRLPLVISPTACTPKDKELLFFPNEREILMFELHDGRLLRKLRVPGPSSATVRSSKTGGRLIKNRVTGLVWRGGSDGLYSAHSDGQIRAWLPKTTEDDELDHEEDENRNQKSLDESEDKKRKRKVLDDVFRDLTRQKISFG